MDMGMDGWDVDGEWMGIGEEEWNRKRGSREGGK
jgi:hypothetical protein